MTVNLLVTKESVPGEQRVALVPGRVASLKALGVSVFMQREAGHAAGYPDTCYADVTWLSQDEVISRLPTMQMLFCLHTPAEHLLQHIAAQTVLIGQLDTQAQASVELLRERQVSSFALQWLPRITRAQSMDILSSQAACAGYRAVLIAANASKRFFPMLTTAAGTIKPATVLVVGAGVAGLQAIATAKRLGAQVYAYDIRSEVAEQIASLGAQMIDTGIDAAGSGGYARELSAEEKQQQQDALAAYVAKADIVITTAAIPGKPAPRIISQAMITAMQPGSVVVDIAAESGGNVELTQAGESLDINGVRLLGPVNLASQLAQHASDMFSRNVYEFAKLMLQEQQIVIPWDDPLVSASCVTHAQKRRTHAQDQPLLEQEVTE